MSGKGTRIARVQMPDGRVARVEVPANSTPEQVLAIANRVAPKQKPPSHAQGFAEGILPYAANAVRMLAKTNPVTMLAEQIPGAGKYLPSSVANTAQQRVEGDFKRSPYRGSTGGKIAGSIVGSAPSFFLPGGPTAQGGAAGLLGNTDKSVRGLATDAAIGAVGGKVGDKVVRTAARIVSPKVAPAITRLKERGIPLTVGQIAGASNRPVGNFVKNVEDKLTSIPGVGNSISNARARGYEAFNKAAFDEALSPIGARVPEVGEVGVEQAKQAVRQGYADALGNVRVTPDKQLQDEIIAAAQLGQRSGGFVDDYNRIMRDEIGPVLSSGEGAITGQSVQDALRMLRGYGRQYGKLATTGAGGIPQPAAKPAGQSFDDIAASVEALVNRQAPGAMPAYNAANSAYRNVGVVRDAVNAAKNTSGQFTPAQLSQAARTNAKRFGGTQGTTDQPFFQLTRDAQDVLPSTVPNSGTVDRGTMGLLVGGTVGLPAVAASGVASLPYTKAGQKLAEWLLTGRQSANAKATAKFIEDLRSLGVGAGALGLPPLLGSR